MSTIPPKAHFFWIGPSLPFAYVFAVRSAALRGELEAVTLHHTDALQPGPELELLAGTPGVTLARVDPLAWLESIGADLGVGAGLAELYARVDRPVARSNILRAAVLYEQGGIYLDLDTVTLHSLRPLLKSRQFLGYEHIVWPYFVLESRSPLLKLKSEALSWARTLCRLMPAGYRVFRKLAPLYYECINGAISGGIVRGPLMASYLRAMLRVPLERQMQPHALGTYLLQEVVAGYTGDDLEIHGPDVFYPLAPEVSEHWFRIVERVDLADVLRPTTRVVHWYASVRTRELLPKISPSYVKMHASRQLYSALVAPFVELAGEDSVRDGVGPSSGSA